MGSHRPPERYRFGPFELQLDQRRLLKDGATISLRPRAFDLLAALVDRAGRLVTKDELLDQIWPKMVVEEAALHVQVSALRKVLGADAITTVSGRGYQFTLSVTKGDSEANRASRSKHNLPYQLTSFIGREQEIAQLGAAAHLREEIGLRTPPHEERERARVAEATHAALGDDAFDQASPRR
jgi:non-specific serine/threonine protein kinase